MIADGRTLDVGIVGAGIGGLTASLALGQLGVDVTVYERSSALGEIGAGIQMSPNATRVFERLGLLPVLEAVAVQPATGDLRRWEDWSLIVSQPLGSSVREQFGLPYLHVHRADLLRVLVDAQTPGVVETGRQAVGVDSVDGRVELGFADGTTATHDVVVGADGIHSVIREALFGPEQPRFSNSAAWRGLVPSAQVESLGIPVSSTAVLGPDAHLVHYYVRSGELVNWVGVTPSEDWTDESWTAQGSLADALSDFAEWAPTVRSLVAAVGDAPIFRWALYDRDPLPRWSDGRVTLLGDACHAMLPFMAQGAAQSIEDAAVLARCLTERPAVDQALLTYESLRRERTALVQERARANAVMFHLPDGADQRRRDAGLAESAGAGGSHRNAWLFDYDAAALDLDPQ